MTILEKMKELNSNVFEHKLNEKYYLFIEGLDENGCDSFETINFKFPIPSDIELVKSVLVEVHKMITEEFSDFEETLVETLGDITLDTKLEDLTFEKVKELCDYELD